MERDHSNDASIEGSIEDSRFNAKNILGSLNKEVKEKPRYELRAATSQGYGRKIPTLLNKSVFNSKEISDAEKTRIT